MARRPVKQKAYAYVTHRGRLLVMTHPDSPEAGIQVPAGSIRPGESPLVAALREAGEETGLAGLSLVRALGTDRRDMSDTGRHEVHERWFFHVSVEGEPPSAWEHEEPDPPAGTSVRIRLAFQWAELPDGVPPLTAGHGAFLPELLRSLDQSSRPA